jgi:hypothetical protein
VYRISCAQVGNGASCVAIDVGRTNPVGAEGATAPETLRPQDRRRQENSGEWQVAARRRDSNLRHQDRGGITHVGIRCRAHVVPFDREIVSAGKKERLGNV